MQHTHNDPALKNSRRELRRNQTDAEKLFWQRVRAKQCIGLKFFRQYSIGPYILDFYCPQIKLAVELDGGQHNTGDAKTYDEERTNYLQTHGIEVLRYWNHDVLQHIDSVLSKIIELSEIK
jgi:very-short-patch-repair endonuclease